MTQRTSPPWETGEDRGADRADTVTPEDRPLALTDWGWLAVPGLIWGSSFYLIAESLDSFAPFLVTWLRLVLGFVVVVSVPAARRSIPAAAWRPIGALGVIWMAVPLTLFSFAEERVSSSVTGMLNGGMPVFAACVAGLIVRRLPPRRQQLGLVIGVLGVVLIALPTWSEGSSSANGILMIVAALACYGVAINVAGPAQRSYGGLAVVARALGLAAILTSPFGIAAFGESSFGWGSVMAVVVLGGMGSGVAFLVMAGNAGKYGSTRASSTTYLIPAVSLLLGAVIRDEAVAALAVVGSGIAVLGAYLVNSGTRRTR